MKSLKTILGIALSVGGLGTAATVTGVSIAQGNRAVVDSVVEATNTSGETFYLDCKSATWWSGTGAKLSLNFYGGKGNAQLFTGYGIAVSDDSNVFKFTIPDGGGSEGYTTVIGVRQNSSATSPSWDNRWNQTQDVTIGNNNCIKVTGNGDDMSKSAESSYYIDTIGLLGSYVGGSWDSDVPLSMNKTNKIATYSTSITFRKNDTFKLRANGEYHSSWGGSALSNNAFATACFTTDGQGNAKALHDCTVTNISLNYSTGVITLTGEQAAQDSEDVHYLHLYTASTGQWTDETVVNQQGSTTEWMGQFTFGIGDKFLFDIANTWYNINSLKNGTGIYDEHSYIWNDGSGNFLVNVAGTYTVYLETASGNNFGIWLQKDTVTGAENSKQFAIQFNTAISAVCDYDGINTDPDDLQAAWQAQADLFGDQVDEVKNYLKVATASHSDSDVAAFIAKYTKVYTLRGSILASHGGDFLNKGITPTGTNAIGEQIKNASNNSVSLIIIASSALSLTAVGAFFILRKKKHN